MTAKIRKGDMVKILSGKDRSRRGRVLAVFPRQDRVLIEGANLKKRHRRSRRADRKGEVVLLPSPLARSAVQLLCPRCGKPTRVGYEWDEAGKKVRRCKKCKAIL